MTDNRILFQQQYYIQCWKIIGSEARDVDTTRSTDTQDSLAKNSDDKQNM